jgi:hypothetical protein
MPEEDKMKRTLITMSVGEIERLEVVSQLVERLIKEKDAAVKISLSTRQVRRLKAAFKKEGRLGLIHKSRGRPSNNRMPDKDKEKIKKIIIGKYHDFGPTLAWEKLDEIHGFNCSDETIRQIMIESDIWKPKKRKAHHREWRERKECLGEMIQFDGSDHDWFEGRNKGMKRYTLLAHIDDATGRLMGAVFARNESLMEVFKATKKYLLTHGKPVSLYIDRHSIYKKNQRSMLDRASLTQFERAMEELTTGVIHARTPQAKGRVERLFGTLQDRLVKEIRLRGINDIESANQFLEDFFITDFNRRFAKEPKRRVNLHRQVNLQKENIDQILSRQEKRFVNNDFTLQYKNRIFQLEKSQLTLVLRRDKVMIEERMNGEIKIRLRNKYLNFHQIYTKPRQELFITALAKEPKKPWIPPQNHPWRRPFRFTKERTVLLWK